MPMYKNGHPMKVGTVWPSKFSGDFEIIEDLGKINGNTRLKIRFKDTGYENIVQYSAARKGEVKDPTNYRSKVSNIEYQTSNYGPVKIIYDYGIDKLTDGDRHRYVDVEFTNTGSIVKHVRYDAVINGNLKDPKYNNIKHARKDLGIQPMYHLRYDLKKIWMSMMSRCYNPDAYNYHLYGAKGVTVDLEWHNFDNFFEDAQKLPGWDLKKSNTYDYHLDKDYLQQHLPHNQRVYSKRTCIWLHVSFNTKLANYIDTEIFPYGSFNYGNFYYTRINIFDIPYLYGPYDLKLACDNQYAYLNNIYKLGDYIEPNMDPQEMINHNINPKELCKIIR